MSASPSPSPRTAAAAGGPAQRTDSDVSHTILRIKRKRGQDPVEALVIQQAERRAKRRSNLHSANPSRSPSAAPRPLRSGAPSDAEDDQAARPEASRGVFRLAETVSLESFSDPAAARLLHDRITALSRAGRDANTLPIAPLPAARQPASELPRSQRSSASPAPPSGTVSDPLHRSLASLDSSRDGLASPAALTALDGAPRQTPAGASSDVARKEDDRGIKQKSSMASSMRFKVVRKEPLGQLRHAGSTGSLRRKLKGVGAASRPWQDSRHPPQIRSKKEKDAEAVFGRIIDAVSQAGEGRSKGGKAKPRVGGKTKGADPDMDALDSRFAELLGNYLEASNLEPPADLGAALTGGRKRDHDSDSYSDSASNDDDDSDDDYVYDIYYRDMIPSRTGPAGAAESGLQPAAVPGHERLLATRSSLPESMALPRVQGGAVVPAEMAPPATAHFPGLDVAGAETVMAQLEGFEDTDDELDAGDDAEGYESYDEGEDEDSNDEDFYRNDYPEEELPDEDDVDFGAYNDDSDDDEQDPYALSDGSF
ncbi:uncharacterized protein PFL1_03689 [Pseudozyma flocculosa PF-1]|uniref:Transcription factor Iwr1 domain-containing protein n=1 Tax=Pseudozyma flocculosa PF-1 TaxID=1277687 RepID=A0A061H8D2_9BASI|nr:uncharacterized protein PFL1_03689 [Pseudozyma flocculosa PF-1]EPQ28888.1 hypothetical protein PFL1_03689 [Pseudozyma flocculosa PF-1]